MICRQIIKTLHAGLNEKALAMLKSSDRYLSTADVVKLCKSGNTDGKMIKFLLKHSIHRAIVHARKNARSISRAYGNDHTDINSVRSDCAILKIVNKEPDGSISKDVMSNYARHLADNYLGSHRVSDGRVLRLFCTSGILDYMERNFRCADYSYLYALLANSLVAGTNWDCCQSARMKRYFDALNWYTWSEQLAKVRLYKVTKYCLLKDDQPSMSGVCGLASAMYGKPWYLPVIKMQMTCLDDIYAATKGGYFESVSRMIDKFEQNN